MSVDRLSITLDPQVGATVRKAARRAKVSLSTWIAEATMDRIRNEALGSALDHWEAEHGAFTTDELAAAERELGFPPVRKSRRS